MGSGTEKGAPIATPVDPQAMIGKVLDGRYRVLDIVGVGGMGIVYKALRVPLERLVAIKVLSPECLRVPMIKERFAREARVTNRIAHHNVLDVEDIGETDDGLPYQVMDFLYGETLYERLQRGRISLAELLDVALQVCTGLAAAHDLGIVHRDVTPSNIFLVRRGTVGVTGPAVKILDFGIAFVKTEARLTLPGQMVGTPSYVAPEIVTGGEVTAAVDVYGLGAVLYEALTGRPVFEHPNVAMLAMMHVTEDPVPIAQLAPKVPPRLASLVMSCLRKQARDRPAGARVVAEEIRATMREASIPVRRSVAPGATIEDDGAVRGSAAPAAVPQVSGASVAAWRDWAARARQGAVASSSPGGLAQVERLVHAIDEIEQLDRVATERLQAKAEIEERRAAVSERFERALETLRREEARLADALAALDRKLAEVGRPLGECRRVLAVARCEVAAAENGVRQSPTLAGVVPQQDDAVDEAVVRALRIAGEAAAAYEQAAGIERASRRARLEGEHELRDTRFQIEELTGNSGRQLAELDAELRDVQAALARHDERRQELYGTLIDAAAALSGRSPS